MSNCSWAVWFVSVLFAALAGAFAFRYFSLKRGLREMDRELLEIRRELSRNRILHLPLPDRDLERVLCSVNELLEEIRGHPHGYPQQEIPTGGEDHAGYQKELGQDDHDGKPG